MRYLSGVPVTVALTASEHHRGAQGRPRPPRGPLVVRWVQDTIGQFHLQVVAPAGTGGEVWVPLASATGTSSPLITGSTFLRRAGAYHVYRVGAGTFEFSSAA